jgi:hypothetical protein
MNVVAFHKKHTGESGLYILKWMRTDIVRSALKFDPDKTQDVSQMQNRWQFLYEVDDVIYACGIWDYEGTKQEEELHKKKNFWFYGPRFIAEELFGEHRVIDPPHE